LGELGRRGEIVPEGVIFFNSSRGRTTCRKKASLSTLGKKGGVIRKGKKGKSGKRRAFAKEIGAERKELVCYPLLGKEKGKRGRKRGGYFEKRDVGGGGGGVERGGKIFLHLSLLREINMWKGEKGAKREERERWSWVP